jgi:prepilin peptidase dependent protein B
MRNQLGLNLIEVMISLAIGLFLLLAVISIYGITIRGSTNIFNTARLNHDMEAVMALMVNDIRRAGYWRGATVSADIIGGNVFMEDDVIAQIPVDNTECILYSYDSDLNSTDPEVTFDSAVDDSEFFGFRRVEDAAGNGRIEMRTNSTLDDAADCTKGQWASLTNQNQLNITSLEFSYEPLSCGGSAAALTATSRCLNLDSGAIHEDSDFTECAAGAATGNYWAEKRVINICLQAELIADSSVRHTMASSIEIRNNRVGKKN